MTDRFSAVQVHCGQYRPYGDFFRVWDVTTAASEAETLEWCFNNLYKRRVPREAEWHANTRYGGEKWGDMDYHFAGYYKMAPIQVESARIGFRFTICEPFAD